VSHVSYSQIQKFVTCPDRESIIEASVPALKYIGILARVERAYRSVARLSRYQNLLPQQSRLFRKLIPVS
jgi:hypothetical protein